VVAYATHNRKQSFVNELRERNIRDRKYTMNNADKDKADKLFKMIQPSFKIDVISKLDARDPG